MITGCVIFFTWLTLFGQDRMPINTSQPRWNVFHHESGVDYYLRQDSIIGVCSVVSKDQRVLGGRTELILTNGRSIYTDATIEQILDNSEGVTIDQIKEIARHGKHDQGK